MTFDSTLLGDSMVLPAGFSLPTLPYLVVLGVALGVVVWGGLMTKPTMTASTVVGFVPWMLTGASFHVIYQLALVHESVRPFFGTPAAYLTTAVIAGSVWLLSARYTNRSARILIGSGTGVFGVVLGWIVLNNEVAVWWPLIGILTAVVVSGVVWRGLHRINNYATSTTGWPGFFVVFGHGLDAVSTAIGIDILHLTERTPAADLILTLGAHLPTAAFIGVGWLFVVVKLGLASLIVIWFADYIDESPTNAYLVFTLLIAIGLGPGIHNLLLYLTL